MDLREQVQCIRSDCASPFCVNLVLAFEQRERLMAVLDEGAAIVSYSWGVDAGLISVARDAGAYVLVQVASLGDACHALASGADALIVQGIEAGGHVQSSRPLLELLREIRPKLDVPLLAAGGIADAASRDDAREAGGDAVVCGTVFLAAHEANVHPTYLEHLIKTTASETTLTTVFDGGWPDAPHRVIRNDTLAVWEAAGMPARGNRPGEGDQIATRNRKPALRYDDAQPTRDTSGDIALMAMYAGTSVRAVSCREPASHIVERLRSGV
jgi:NAD(P)H-dependent flavin oxidoreductase YrpB (nitropropane dioxygenase family)